MPLPPMTRIVAFGASIAVGVSFIFDYCTYHIEMMSRVGFTQAFDTAPGECRFLA